jgi:two-component system, cell cycle sensor histidine kinase and response regulator CckA
MEPHDHAHFFKLSSDLLCVTDAIGTIIHANAALQQLVGVSEAELNGRPLGALLHPEDQAQLARYVAQLAADEPAPGLIVRCRTAAGGCRRIQWRSARDATSKRLYLLGQDLSAANEHMVELQNLRAHAEQAVRALRVSEGRLAETQRMAQVGSWERDLVTNRLWWSAEVYRIFEVDPARSSASLELFRQMVHPDDRAAVNHAYAEAVASQQPYMITHRLRMPDGRIKHVREHARTIYDSYGAPIQSIGTLQDITTWHESQNDLLRKEAAIAASLNGVAMAGMDGILTYVNQSFLDLWGYCEPAQVLGRPAISFWGTPDAASAVVEAIQRTGIWQGELTALRADGVERTMQVNASLLRDIAGAPIGMLASFRDITERKKNEDALRLKDQAIATSLNAMMIAGADSRLIYVNQSFLRLWGYAAEDEVLGQPLTQLADTDAMLEILEQLYTTGAWQGELTARRKDGISFEVLLSANPVRNAEGVISHLVGSMLDISEAKRLQTQFLQAQKMESVGRLAGGVAHDFNNLLTVMKGYLDLTFLSLRPDDPLLHDLAQVSKAVDSAAGLTQQLLAFSRRQIIAPQAISLNTVIMRVQRMLRRLIGEDIELRTILAEDLAYVHFDPGQCEQIIINLAVNARDAMPLGGRLTLETAQVHLDAEHARAHSGSTPGDYVLLAISDTGVGMSAEVQAHLFEPFFTTKEPGKGTGLGLAMVYGAVSQNSGQIEVYSEPNKGTTIKIYLPPVQPLESTVKATPLQALPRGNQTIILVEDDEAVRTLATRLLEQQGYRALAFRDGPTTLQALSRMAEPVDLLITDVILPQMNGRVLAEQIKALHPSVKVLFTSGYTANMIVNHGILQQGIEFLPKPYSIMTLARRVREVLAAP